MMNIWLVEVAKKTAEGTEQNWNCTYAVTDYNEALKTVRDLNRLNLAKLREGLTEVTAVFRLRDITLFNSL